MKKYERKQETDLSSFLNYRGLFHPGDYFIECEQNFLISEDDLDQYRFSPFQLNLSSIYKSICTLIDSNAKRNYPYKDEVTFSCFSISHRNRNTKFPIYYCNINRVCVATQEFEWYDEPAGKRNGMECTIPRLNVINTEIKFSEYFEYVAYLQEYVINKAEIMDKEIEKNILKKKKYKIESALSAITVVKS
jgi:hypothetical protein